MALGQLDNLQSLSRRSKGAKEVLVLDTADVVPKDGQVRVKFAGIEELADSIKSHGQEQPIIVYPKDANGKYRIQKGERRWRACKQAGVPVEAIVNKKDQDELDETAGELIENIQRENLTPMEIAKGIQKFIDEDWKAVDVAKRLGKSRGFISQHLSLLKLPECVQKLYEEEVTADPESLNSLRQIYQIAPEKAERICEKALVDGISRKACRELLKQAKNGTLAEDPVTTPIEPQGAPAAQGTHDDQPPLSGLDSTPAAPQSGEGGTTAGSQSAESTHTPKDDSPTPGKGDVAPIEPQAPKPIANKEQPIPKETVGAKSEAPAPVMAKEPARARIVVSVKVKGAWSSGLLQTDRIDHEPGYCWVRLDNDEMHTLRVSVSDVKLLGVEGED
ncbi:ParB/RepB/Spo0J family partition protein [Halomonas sp. AOP13-D3-9]